MKNKNFILSIIALMFVALVSCTPENNKDEYQEEVDKDKIERPGSQGGN